MVDRRRTNHIQLGSRGGGQVPYLSDMPRKGDDNMVNRNRFVENWITCHGREAKTFGIRMASLVPVN